MEMFIPRKAIGHKNSVEETIRNILVNQDNK